MFFTWQPTPCGDKVRYHVSVTGGSEPLPRTCTYNSTLTIIDHHSRLSGCIWLQYFLRQLWRGTAPVTARRFHALAARLGDDDMFSSDLTPEEMKVAPVLTLSLTQGDEGGACSIPNPNLRR